MNMTYPSSHHTSNEPLFKEFLLAFNIESKDRLMFNFSPI